MIKLGTQNISALYLGEQKIKKAYLGAQLVWEEGPAPVTTYTIFASINPAGSGTVAGAGRYQAGEQATLMAAPGDGYQFSSWQENGQTISNGESYTFTVNGDRTLVAVFEAAKVSRLPEGYTEVEYIESHDGAYIDTGFKPTKTTKITMDIYPLSIKGNGYFFFSQHYPSSGSYAYYFYCYLTSANKAIGALGRVARSATLYTTTIANAITLKRMIVSADYTTKEMKVGGHTGEGLGSAAVSTSMNSIRFFLYALGKPTDNYLTAKLYSCQIESEGSLVRDFVPCPDPSGNVGLYDIVNTTFYGNKNTVGTFIPGPAV